MPISCRRSRRDCARLVVLFVVAAGCATTDASRVRIVPPAGPSVMQGFDRVLVAGFIATSVSDGGREIDVNEETARFLRVALRSKASLRVVEAEPLQLQVASTPVAPRPEAGPTPVAAVNLPPVVVENPFFTDVPFWKRIGQEYGEPLILTGIVTFKPAGSRYHELTAGRRTMREWRPGFSLAGRLVLISGRTGEIIDAATLRPSTAYVTTSGEPALSVYFRLMDGVMPSILALFGQKRAERILLR